MEKLLIFDMDGTLLDSMQFWKYLGRSYLGSKNKAVEKDLEQKINPMTLQESASYFKQNYMLVESVEVIKQQILSFIADKYSNEIPLKKGVKDYLIKMKALGYKMCVLTTSDRQLAIGALARNKILDFFDKIYTDEDFNLSKDNPKIYLETCKDMNTLPCNTVIYEDSLYAVKSAKKTDATVIGVYDEYSKNDWNEISSIADDVIYNF